MAVLHNATVAQRWTQAPRLGATLLRASILGSSKTLASQKRGALNQTALPRRLSSVAAAGQLVAAVAAEDTDKSLRELNQNDFYSYLEGAGDKLVIVDFYTDWCGPCKVMLPLLEDLAEELQGKADIVKFNCNSENKELGKQLNIRVAPTFHIYKNSNKVAEMSGAKIDALKDLINQNL